MPIPPEKRKRLAPAILFLFGVMASLKAAADSDTFWPPSVVWAAMNNPHRVQFCGGVATIVVAIILTLAMKRD